MATEWSCVTFFTLKSGKMTGFLPGVSFGLWVLSLPASACLCVYQSLACSRDNSGPVQARITIFGPKIQNALVKVPIVLEGNRHRCRSVLVQVMACCLTAPSHYLKQSWLISSKAQWHSSAFSHVIPHPSITQISLKIIQLKFHTNLQGANESNNDLPRRWYIFKHCVQDLKL